jgi:hypothetical protein
MLAPILAGTNPADVASSRCDAYVSRPEQPVNAPITDPAAVLTCELTYADGTTGTVRRSLGDTPVHAWGNRFDRHKPFEVGGPVAVELLDLLGAAHTAGSVGELLDRTAICGPDGRVCLEIYALFRHSADESPAALVCSRETELGRVTDVDCVFHPLAETR